jgi:hypothetical protein
MSKKPALTELRKVLAELYPTIQDAQRVVMEAGLDPMYITFSDKAINNWSNILEEAQKRDRVRTIVELAYSEYPENEALRRLSERVGRGEHLAFSSVSSERLRKQGIGVRSSKQQGVTGWWRTLADRPAIVVLVIFFLGLEVWLMFIVPQEHVSVHLELDPAKVPVSLGLIYPRYIGRGDRGSVDVTICNEADRVISGTVVVDFSDDHIIYMDSSGTNSFEFRDLVTRGRQTSKICFVLNEAPYFDLSRQAPVPVRFGVIVTDAAGNEAKVSDQTIDIAPLPYLRTLMTSGGTLSGILAILLVLPLADWLKKRLAAE